MQFWPMVTRLGEAQILLPLMLLVALWSARERAARAGAGTWVLATAAAALLVTATKVAFIGYGWGLPGWDFTGLSGHAMFAAAVLPVLGALLLAGQGGRPGLSRTGALAGVLLAGVVALSRLEVKAHSLSEVVLGSALGLAAAALALGAFGRHGSLRRGLAGWAGALALAWLAATSLVAPPSRTHDWVTRLSLAVSGRAQPFHRGQWCRGEALAVCLAPKGGARSGQSAAAVHLAPGHFNLPAWRCQGGPSSPTAARR